MPKRPPGLTMGIKDAGLVEGIVGAQVSPGFDFAIDLTDAVKTSLNQFFGSNLTIAYSCSSFSGR